MDRWIVAGDVLIRVHNVARNEPFSPDEDEGDCPFDVTILAPTRLTHAFDKARRKIIMGSWWLTTSSI